MSDFHVSHAHTEYGDAVDELFDLLRLRHPPWHEKALCQGMGAEKFYPPQGTREDPTGKVPNPIRVLCGSCPVRAECLEAGLYDHHGWWGGLSERQRRRLRRQRKATE